jgi:hypothetical protein
MFTKNAVLETERIIARTTILACPVADSRIQDDSIAWTNRRHIRADGVDRPDAVGAEDPPFGDSHTRNALHHPQVEMIQRSRLNPYAYIVWRRELRHRGIVAKSQLIECAMGVDR